MKQKEYIHEVILNLIQDLRRLLLSFINDVRGRSRIKSGMRVFMDNNNTHVGDSRRKLLEMTPYLMGFTLVELLIVVVIIGILAAVAVPQYRFAVDKAQLATFFPAVTSLLRAQEMYYLSNGEYAAKITDLDVDISKVCPSLGGSTHENDLYNCKFGYKIINAAHATEGRPASTKVLYLVLCPRGTNMDAGSGCGTSNYIMNAIFYFQHHEARGAIGCNYHGNRGMHLCETVVSYFKA